MDMQGLRSLRRYGMGLALLMETAQLTWEQCHGGVLRHHLLNRADLPAISNGWGLLLLPALAWFLLGRIYLRSPLAADGRTGGIPGGVRAAFAGSLLFGLLLSGCFTCDLARLTEYLFEGMLLLALLLPVYRAEYVLGFILGMSLVFGVVLPALIAVTIAALSAFMRNVVYSIMLRLWRGFQRKRLPGT